MNQVQVSILVVLFSLLLVTLTQTSPVPDAVRIRRSSADQRIAELQALIAIHNSKVLGRNTQVGHGLFDPNIIGKKKRDPQYASVSDEERYNLLKALLQRAAIENTSS